MCHTQLGWIKGYTCMRLSPEKHSIIIRREEKKKEIFYIKKNIYFPSEMSD